MTVYDDILNAMINNKTFITCKIEDDENFIQTLCRDGFYLNSCKNKEYITISWELVSRNSNHLFVHQLLTQADYTKLNIK